MSWSRIYLAMLEDELCVKDKSNVMVREGKNKWPRRATSRSGSQRRATTSGHNVTEREQQVSAWRNLEEQKWA
jgi:hypothetical protein